MEVTLNGSLLVGGFTGLPERYRDDLTIVGLFWGIPVYSTTHCPLGTLEIWDNGTRVAIIEGIGLVS